MKLNYNPHNKNSIILYAKKLVDNTLRDICDEAVIRHNLEGKGNFGQILEKFYFGYNPNSRSEPDFPEVGLELKTSPLKILKSNNYRSKERLVLNKIDYKTLVNQDFYKSDFWKKNANLLLVFYLHQIDTDVLDFVIKIVDEWKFNSEDLQIIKQDWEFIKQKVANGKAHELSEGDTYYLGACTKGVNADSKSIQPFNDIPAKQRAFSLKQGYVNHIIASLKNDNSGKYGKILNSTNITENSSIENIVISKFQGYYDKSINQIIKELGINLNSKSKSFYSNLSKAILGIELDKEIEEFHKAEIKLKTVRIDYYNKPKEDISFPFFSFENIINESWDDSEIKEVLEHKFLFVFFQYQSGSLVLRKVKFWNMPPLDLMEVEKVFNFTKEIISNGNIIREIKNNKRYTNFPSSTQNRVAHVRPHAKNAMDTIKLPIPDKLTKIEEYTKHCFWLNKSYVANTIYLKN